jgi:hypothetical protein
MRPLKRFARGELGLTRIEAFSDGIFAIVITLLVLELKVPSLQGYQSVNELEPSPVQAQVPHIIRQSFVGVFFYFGAAGAGVSVHIAFVVYLLTPLFFFVPSTMQDAAQAA